MLFKNVRFAVTPEGIKENMNIIIENGSIAQTGAVPAGAKRDEVIDCSKLVALPGLVNTHTHVPMTFLRGYAEDLPLQQWFEKIWPTEAKLTREDVRAFALAACVEMIKTGTTAFNDQYFHEDAVAEAAVESGLRAFLATGVLSVPALAGITGIKIGERFIKEWKGKNELVTPLMGPHSIYTCDEETMRKCAELAEKHDVRLHTHLSETRKEVYDCWRERKMRPVEYLDKIGFLSERVIAAHCGWLTKNEIRILGERRIAVAHCPVSNMKLATGGEFPLPELLGTKAIVTLGTDGPASNNTLNMFETIKYAALVHKHFRWDATATAVPTMVRMATANGAHALGYDGGLLAAGRAADIILVDAGDVAMLPLDKTRALNQLVYSNPRVIHSIINGKLVMKNGVVTTLDEEDVLEEFQKRALKLAS